MRKKRLADAYETRWLNGNPGIIWNGLMFRNKDAMIRYLRTKYGYKDVTFAHGGPCCMCRTSRHPIRVYAKQ